MTTYDIVLADDHVILRQGLRMIIEGTPGLAVVGEASNGLDLLRLARQVPFDLAIVDISMPRLRGIEAVPELRLILPEVKVLFLSMHSEMEFVKAALAVRADGYLLKEDADTHLFAAIAKVRRGGTYLSPRLAEEMAREWAQAYSPASPPETPGSRLTVRERQILKLTAEGNSSREISRMLFISARTVEHHRAHIMTKLGLRKATDVVRYAMHEGYL